MRTVEELQKLQQEIFSQPDAKAPGYYTNNDAQNIARLTQLQADIKNGKNAIKEISTNSGEFSDTSTQKRTDKEFMSEINKNNMLVNYFNKGVGQFGTGVAHSGLALIDKVRRMNFDTVTDEQIKEADGEKNKKSLWGSTLFPEKSPTKEEINKRLSNVDFIKKGLVGSINQGLTNNAVSRGDADMLKRKKANEEKFKDNIENSQKDLNNKASTKSAMIEEKYKDANPTVKGVVQFLGEGVGGMAPAMALNLALPGVGTAVMGVSSGGHAYKTAIEDGATEDQAFANAILSGATTATIEKVAGGMPTMGKGMINFGGLDKLAKSNVGKAILTRLGESLGEGLEEGVEAFIQPHLQALTYGKEVDYKNLPKEVLANAGAGIALSGVLGTGGDVVNSFRNKTNATISKNGEIIIEKGDAKAENVTIPTTDASFTENLARDKTEQQNYETNPLQAMDVNTDITDATQNDKKLFANYIAQSQENTTIPPQKTVTLKDAAYAYSHSSELPSVDMSTVTKNGQEQIDDNLNITVTNLLNSLNVQGKKINQKQRTELKQFLNNTVVTEMLNNKNISKEYLDEVFETVYNRGIAEQNAFVTNYGNVIDAVDKGPIMIDLEQMRGATKRLSHLADLARNNVMLSDSEGVTISQKYDELAQMHPNLFKQNATHDIDKLAAIIEVTKAVRQSKAEVNNFKGERQAEFKGYARKSFDENINALTAKLNDVNNLARKVAPYIAPQAKEPVTMSDISQAYLKGEALPDFDASKMTERGKEHTNRYLNDFVKNVADNLSVPGKSINHNQRKAIKQYAENLIVSDYLQNGKLDERRLNEVFEAAYKRGVIEQENFYNDYKDLGRHLKSTVLTLDTESQKSREYIEIKDSAKRLVKIQADGVPVDVKYMELSGRYPNLFPSDIDNPLNQLEQIVEVARAINKSEVETKNYYGENEQEYKTFAKEKFDRDTNDLINNLKKVARYEASKNNGLENQDIDISYESVKKANTEVKKLSRQLAKVQDKHLLIPSDKDIVERLLKGTTLESSLLKMDNIDKEGILAIYHAKKALLEARKPIDASKLAANKKIFEFAKDAIAESTVWKDKKLGLAYSTDTFERNILDITNNSEDGKKFIKQYVKVIHENEALSNKFKNRMRDTLRPLKLNKWETQYAQMLGEKQSLDVAKKMNVYKSKAEIEYVTKIEAAFYKDFKGQINLAKVQTAIDTIRKNYDEIIEAVNKTYTEYGLPTIEYKQGYFPHFRVERPDTLLKKFAVTMGFNINTDELPTDINGITHTFKPSSRWNPNKLERVGFETDYDLLQGFENYIDIAADVIYHTGDIKKGKAIEMALREMHGTEGEKQAIKAIRENTELTETEIDVRLEAIRKKGNTHLSNFVNYIGEYTNNLANKKSLADRGTEQMLNRGIYTAAANLEQRVAANMIAGNVGSWMTNLIPLTQLSAECSIKSITQAMQDTVKNYSKNDGFADNSVFLTNRKGGVSLVQTKLQKAVDVISWPMQSVDMFVSSIAVRAKYLDNVKAGMDNQTAIDDADAYAARLIADRSKGAIPTVFNHKNPGTKLLTMFQVEVNNQLRYLIKDLPRAKQDGMIKSVSIALLKLMIGAYLYNDLYEKLTGRRPALDAISMLNETLGDVTGKKINNIVDIVNDQGLIFSADAKKPSVTLANAVKRIGEQTPFVGGLIFDGGRLSINSAVPNPMKIASTAADALFGDGNSDKASEVFFNEMKKPLYYLVPPAGGGALKKVREGADVLLKGGSYTKDNNGQDKLRFAVENPTAGDIASALFFGPYSTKGGREYIDNGFKQLSAKETVLYKAAMSAGMDGETFRKFLVQEKDITADKNEKGNSIPGSRKRKIQEAINALPLTVEQKMILYEVGGYGKEKEDENESKNG